MNKELQQTGSVLGSNLTPELSKLSVKERLAKVRGTGSVSTPDRINSSGSKTQKFNNSDTKGDTSETLDVDGAIKNNKKLAKDKLGIDDYKTMSEEEMLSQTRSNMEQSIELAKQKHDYEMNQVAKQQSREKEQGDRAMGAVSTNIMGALGRDQFGYSINKEQLKGLNEAYGNRLKDLDSQRTMMKAQYEANKREMEQALQKQDQSAVEYLKDKQAQLENQLHRNSMEAADKAAELQKEAINMNNQKLQQLADIGELTAGMTSEQLMDISEQFEIPYDMVKFQSEKVTKANISEQLQAEYEAKQNGLKTISTLFNTPEIFAGMKDIPNASKTLAESLNVDESLAASVISSAVDIMGSKEEDRALKIQQAKATLENTQAQTAAKYASMSEEMGGYDPYNTGDAIKSSTQFKNGDTMPDSMLFGYNKEQMEELRGQCAVFPRAMLGLPKGWFGGTEPYKSKEDKLNKINITDTSVVKPGMVFIADGGENDPWGHVGMVESVNPDGTLVVSDFNRGDGKKFSRRPIKIEDLGIGANSENIVGFFDLQKYTIEHNYNPATQKPWGKSVEEAGLPENYEKVMRQLRNADFLSKSTEGRKAKTREIDEAIKSGEVDLSGDDIDRVVGRIKRQFKISDEDSDLKKKSYVDKYEKFDQKMDKIVTAQSTVEQIMNELEVNDDFKGVGDIGLMYSNIKAFDPESIVQTQEINLFQEALPMIDKFKVQIQNLSKGEAAKFTPELREAITKIVEMQTVANNMRKYDMMVRAETDSEYYGYQNYHSPSDYVDMEYQLMQTPAGIEFLEKMYTQHNKKYGREFVSPSGMNYNEFVEKTANGLLDEKNTELGSVPNQPDEFDANWEEPKKSN